MVRRFASSYRISARASIASAAAIFALTASAEIAFCQEDVEQKLRDILERGKAELNAQAGETPSPTPTPVTSQKKPPSVDGVSKRQLPKLPSEKRFYEFQRRHRDHSTIHLLVNASDPKHLAQVLAAWNSLRGKENAFLREIAMVNPSPAISVLFSDDPVRPDSRPVIPEEIIPPAKALLKLFKTSFYYRVQSLHDTIAFKDVSSFKRSPVWIVKTSYGTFRYEGFISIADSFDQSGVFQQRGGDAEKTKVTESGMPLDRIEGGKLSEQAFTVLRQQSDNAEVLKRLGSSTLALDPLIFAPDYIGTSDATDSFDLVPTCRSSVVRRDMSLGQSELEFDAYVYDPTSKLQSEQALKTSAYPIPYIPSATVNPFFDGSLYEQELIRSWNLRCLPTRIRTLHEAPKTLLEYREGSLAASN